MTKKDIVNRCHENMPILSKSLIKKALNLILREISLTLSKGENVKISNFGTWQRRETKRRNSKSFNVKLKPSKALLMYLNASDIKIRK